MTEEKQGAVVPSRGREPFGLLRQMTSELDRAFEDWPSFSWPTLRFFSPAETTAWTPKLEVFERDKHLVMRADLPGMKKEDVLVEVTDGHLAISGERKRATEEKKDNIYRSEREYGSFYRAIPLPDGVSIENVKATFADGVLEVSIPVPASSSPNVRKVQIDDMPKPGKNAA